MKGSFAMGYSISHGGTKHGYSYLSISQFADQLKANAGWSEWRRLKRTFSPKADGYFTVPPGQAALIGQALLDATPRLPAEWRPMARQIGESALRAARAGETWVWS